MHKETLKRGCVWVALASIVTASTYLWWASSGALLFGSRADICISLGRLFGIYAQLMLLFQVMLVARIKLLEDAFGFEKMNTVHRFTGLFVLLFLFAHPILLAYGYATQFGAGFWEQMYSFVVSWRDVIGGAFAIGIYAAVGLTSWHIVRYKLKYEYWYGVHFLTYLALFAGFGHQNSYVTFGHGGIAALFWQGLMLGTVGLFLAYRWVYPIWLTRKHRFVVEKVVTENDNTVSIFVTGRKMDEFIFEAGQYTAWRFHFGSLRRQFHTGFIFPHPFSFSQTYNGTNIRMTAKALGDFTRQLPQLEVGTRVTIARPLGRFVLPRVDKLHGVDPTTKLLFIGGGIGITPLRALAEAAQGLGLDSTLLYGAKVRSDFALLNECKKFCTKVTCFVSNEVITEQGFYSGVIDATAIERECPDVRTRHVYVCGPKPMMMSIVTQLGEMGVPTSRIHYEKFGY
jgi:predicted ferric reductase